MIDFESIYDEYFSDIYRFVLSLSRDRELSEEVTQETFFKALKGIDSFKGNCHIKVWLCQIAKNTYFTHVRKKKTLGMDAVQKEANDCDIERSLIDKEKSFKIHLALHNLEDPYKEVFTLRVFGELSFSEISKLFGKTDSWARVTFYRAKQKIQKKLSEEYSYE